MSRSAKTSHVMSLVGQERKSNQKSQPNKLPDSKTDNEIKNPALREIISSQKMYSKSDEEDKDSEIIHTKNPSSGKQPEADLTVKEDLPVKGRRLTAIVPELINEELETVVKRFKLPPTDSSLWKLTKAALESIRPEFSHDPEEYTEKTNRLRQSVILEMTKAAIKISKEKSSE